MHLTIRARLTLLYFVVLAASFVAFFWICDFGFRRSIEITVNDASRSNLETVSRVIDGSLPKGIPKVQKELSELAGLWANSAIFEVAGADGQWIFRPQRFQVPQAPLPEAPAQGMTFVTTNLEALQYRIAREHVIVGGNVFLIDAAVPTEPFDQALDRFRLTEKRFLPLLVVLASLLGYWLSGRALAPVNRIVESAESIGVQNLSQRLEVPREKDELRRLTETLNAMLGRIESSVAHITQFTADASHDLRTPLALIRTNAEIALRRPRREDEYRATLGRILAAAEESTQLIEQLLMLARADAGAAQLRFEAADLSQVLHTVSAHARILAHATGLGFSTELDSEPLPVLMDSSAVERLLLALLDNAVKYTPEGSISLRLYSCEGQAIVEVRDTGAGISETDLPHIFDRFYRADQARSREVRGSGLGLAIARWIAEMHRGAIEVESELGRGSRFCVHLPLLNRENSAAVAPERQKTTAGLAV
ncbi:MAG TPA: ATP-binding protein [Candidatus Acidoferrum sp.]|nr:ATP-binding protein [Candidatus Acidoferrum sp.]